MERKKNYNDDLSRGQRLVQMTLNKELQEKLDTIRKQKSIYTKRCNIATTDLDYFPDSNESSSSTEDEIEAEQVTVEPNRKIIILSDITIAAPFEHATDPRSTHTDPAEVKNNSPLILSFVEDIVHKIIDEAIYKSDSKIYTKKGDLRKRKMLDGTPASRKKLKREMYVREHDVKKNCRCKKRCFLRIPFSRQKDINKQFWALSKEQQRHFIHASVEKAPKARKTVKSSETRKYSFKYHLKSSKNTNIQVCKVFFLATLGYTKDNDRVLKNVRNTEPKLITPKADRRHHPSNRKIERSYIRNHINSFGPSISHYRREHAPHRQYLPSDISIAKMHKDFQEKFPDNSFSYELYRQEVKNMNISFAQLGQEECWTCEQIQIHKKSTMHDGDDSDCPNCNAWRVHERKYKEARKEYQKDASSPIADDSLRVSADLQKVIMLPRLDTFKEIIFTPRIIAFNETFAPIGSKSKRFPAAMLWHEGIRGRSKDDIISTFYVFFRNNRDIKSITIWLDNCSSQNKNWSLVSFFIYIVNSPEVALETLIIKYFEPGHTFMSADAFHHQVELSLKRKKRVYDFNDFVVAVKEANSSKVDVHVMELHYFYLFTDCISKYKLQKLESKILLRDIVMFSFIRGTLNFSYNTTFAGQLQEAPNIFFAKFKTKLPEPKKCENYKGISLERKNTLISKLKSHIPENRMLFWEQLRVNNNDDDDK